MLKIGKTEVVGFEAAIRSMHNPMKSWGRSDSGICPNGTEFGYCYLDHRKYCPRQNTDDPSFCIGPNDLDLLIRIRNSDADNRDFMRMVVVYFDAIAPLYWWKEFGPCKAETVVSSCSIIHQIVDRGIKLDDFSCENLTTEEFNNAYKSIDILNTYRWVYNNYEQIKKGEIPICKEIRPFINTMDKKEIERQMIQLLPSSYNWKRTLMLNYAVLMNIYISHKSHELNEWKDFCNWIEDLPYSELITGKEKNNAEN